MKILICGYGRHGKDTVGNLLRKHFGLNAVDSSWFMAEKVCLPYMRRFGYEYDSVEACYLDRHNNREKWYAAICEFNGPDLARLSREIFETNEIYVGIRSREEFLAARHLSDLAIWVDASKRNLPDDPTCKIRPEDCDVIVDNNGTEDELKLKVLRLGRLLVRSHEPVRRTCAVLADLR